MTKSKCEHGGRKDRCKECNGSAICEHAKIIYFCKLCHGFGICNHNRLKRECKDCKGSAFCKHQKIKYACQECKGSQICVHNKRKTQCKDCHGFSFCEHSRLKWRCRICGGSSFCEHEKRKTDCRLCNTNLKLCEHGLKKQRCKLCGGSAYCKHEKQKNDCFLCLKDDKIFSSKTFCPCGTMLSTARIRSGITTCATHDTKHPKLRIEHRVVEMLTVLLQFEPSAADNITLGGKACDNAGTRRPDTLYIGPDRCIILEVDEDSHQDRETLCELAKVSDQSIAIKHIKGADFPVVHVRFNPDACDAGRYSLDVRVKILADHIRNLLTCTLSDEEKLYNRVDFFFYHSCAANHIDGVKAATGTLLLGNVFPALVCEEERSTKKRRITEL